MGTKGEIHMNRVKLLVVCVVSALADGASAQPAGLLGMGGGPAAERRGVVVHQCIPPEDRAAIEADIARFEAEHPEVVSAVQRGTPNPYRFWPQAGTLYQDLFINNFVDLNPGSGILDWDCSDFSYNGHTGIDVDIRSFADQSIGVPLFAIDDGVVVARADGHFDMQTQWIPGAQANYVVINQPGNRQCWYYHMKNGSVAVALGQQVVAGQQIGLTGSSGISTGPHLHFESRDLPVSTVVEPWAGPCRPGLSEWAAQQPIVRSFFVRDFGFSFQSITTSPPFELPRTGQLGFSDSPHQFWIIAHNLPASSTWRVRYFRPSGAQAADFSGAFQSGANPFYRWSWWWWSWFIPEMTTTAGTWTMRLDINGVQAVLAPVEVRPARTPDFNSPPNPATPSFDPPAPTTSNVIFCRVGTSLIHDDPDYDTVRYAYSWTLNGQVLRQVTSAALSDALRRNIADLGGELVCTVTPHDGRVAGAPTSATFLIEPRCPGDVNLNGTVGLDDLAIVIERWGQVRLPYRDGDASGNGVIGLDDIAVMIQRWTIVCP